MKSIHFLFVLALIISCQEDPPEPIIKYNLVTDVTPMGGGTVNPSSGTFEEGTTISILASASAEYIFSGWSGSLTSNANPLSLVMNSDKSLTATFVEKQYPINITIEGEGTVSEALSGSKITLTAIPSEGWYFKEWKGDISSTENPVEITVDGPKEITVVFIRKNLLSISILGEGSVEKRVDGEITEDSLFNEGTSVELTAIPAIGFDFKEWRGDISSTENPVEIVVDTTKTVTAFFRTKGSFSSYSLIGNWIFSEYGGGGGGGNPYGGGGGGEDGCDLHSLLLEDDNTFTMNVLNYTVIGTYTTDSANSLITFYEDNQEIGTMINAEIDSATNNLEGTFDFPGIFGASSGCNTGDGDPCSGELDSAYNENLTYVPEDRFEQYLIDQGWDDILDNYVVTDNVKNVTSINLEATDNCQQGENFVCNGEEFYDFDTRFSDRITDLSGIEAFVSLENLYLRGNDLDSINLTKNTKLKNFYANFNSFKGINTDNNLELINYSINDNIPDWSEGCFEFTVPDDSITRVSVIYNTKLKSFAPTHMSLGSIDVTNLPELTFLDIPTNNLTSLDLSNNTLLEELRAGNNFLTSIDLSTNSGVLKAIKIGDNNLTELDVTNFPLLEVFSVPGNNLTSIDLSNNPLLREISVKYNTNLEGILDVSFMPNLAGTEDCHNCTGEFYASGTKLDCIQLSEEQLAKYEAGELERWSLGDIPYSLNCN
tara:strand:- start:1556 stop:3694 length:2139 start_codon:yes stop_codon:yes gene_type:complete